jgi:hypothetical protein
VCTWLSGGTSAPILLATHRIFTRGR